MSRAVQIEELDQAFIEMARYFISHWLLDEDEVISPKQFILLRVLYDKQRSTVSDLATVLRQSNSATTIALNRLVKAGYVNRIRDEQDRRVVWVTVSDKAIPLIERLLCKRRNLMKGLLKSLSDEELEQFATYLRKMKQGLEE
ncbi:MULTISPECIES: MarR family winged helix-turn-helix transcriptional regulator [Brevibacillus]|uniref:Transcriptional regulator n=1 Tax=Brevibacillus borstelensis AK1 TaxID=1300222 RepID=M8E4X7_9BACL|nr:MarR family transcriptional regulator [Brevibacillus borstelensis]EMT54346.1 transcriptional regulator [Brevibacillus borstelensis AK1]MCC0564635.1 MarR family transcriptional regulator [Brevibacillus borstelensis]MCM3470146.1 MarR family transcriptional regulator [Brevibacillus borstelensis]MCM3557744.1 MarR family transcriptional regulator [Brevibacillus borstelensis]MCM3589042.1 MarR family transcriptional regulator [Brevibacillus borstelensis]